MKYLFITFFFICNFQAQVVQKTDTNKIENQDTLVVDSGHKDSAKIFKPTIQDYHHFTQFSEKKIFDTVFSVDKTYQFSQFNNQDNFGKIQFANVGEGFQNLVYQTNPEENLALLPTKKSYTILGIKDIKYYDVKTPTTTFIYHNGMKTGSMLQSTYTQNIGKNFNFAIQYFGLRSLGLYQKNLAVSNNTLFSAHFISTNNRYEAFAHYIHQNMQNQENGGISNLDNFLSGDSRFKSRENLAVNLAYSDSRFAYRRYYFSQEFSLLNSEKYPFKIKHTIFHQGNKYYFSQTASESYYTSDYVENYGLSSKKFSENLSNTFTLLFDKEKFKLEAGVRHQMLNLGVGKELIVNNISIPSNQKEQRLGAIANLEIKLLNKIDLNSNLEYSNGKTFGNYLRSENNLKFEPIKGYVLDAKVNFQSSAPSFNYLVNSSFYQDFNYNLNDFKNQNILEIGGKINLKLFDIQIFTNYFRIDNFTYFNNVSQPKQSTSSLNISQIGGNATLKYHKFNLNTKLLFQTVLTNKELLPMPNFISRINVFYQTKAFKNVAEIQTGIKVYYFSKFASREYFPVLNEFILPNSNSYSIGGQPIADIYFNMKVKKMMIFAEAQHFNTKLMKNQSFAAPYYPLYDFRLNLGLVWYLFN